MSCCLRLLSHVVLSCIVLSDECVGVVVYAKSEVMEACVMKRKSCAKSWRPINRVHCRVLACRVLSGRVLAWLGGSCRVLSGLVVVPSRLVLYFVVWCVVLCCVVLPCLLLSRFV